MGLFSTSLPPFCYWPILSASLPFSPHHFSFRLPPPLPPRRPQLLCLHSLNIYRSRVHLSLFLFSHPMLSSYSLKWGAKRVCVCFDVGHWIRSNLVNCFVTKKHCCSYRKRATIVQIVQVTDYVRGNNVIHGECGIHFKTLHQWDVLLWHKLPSWQWCHAKLFSFQSIS